MARTEWNPSKLRWEPVMLSPTIATLRAPSRYFIVSDAQLKRDLRGRTLADVYRENRALRGVERRYVPRWECGDVCDGGLRVTSPHLTLKREYLMWCKARNHTPHPASIDPDHPWNAHRLRAPKAEKV